MSSVEKPTPSSESSALSCSRLKELRECWFVEFRERVGSVVSDDSRRRAGRPRRCGRVGGRAEEPGDRDGLDRRGSGLIQAGTSCALGAAWKCVDGRLDHSRVAWPAPMFALYSIAVPFAERSRTNSRCAADGRNHSPWSRSARRRRAAASRYAASPAMTRAA